MGILTRLKTWWNLLPVPWRAWRVIACVAATDEVPDRLPHKGAVLIRRPESVSWLAFECPCRAGHRLLLNLDTHRSPAWSIVSLRPLSIWPSIDAIATDGRCHFVMSNGRIRWVADDRRENR